MNPDINEKFQQKLQLLNIKYYNLQSNDSFISFALDIWAKPGAKVEKNCIGPNGEVILYIKDRPVEGAANKGLINALAKILSSPKSSIELVKGSRSKFKRFSLHLTFTERKNIDYYVDRLNNLAGK